MYNNSHNVTILPCKGNLALVPRSEFLLTPIPGLGLVCSMSLHCRHLLTNCALCLLIFGTQEGILDSLMYILSSYFRNYSSYLRDETPGLEVEPFSAFQKGGIAFYHARLAANCCVALGKAHCAAIHTEGDLLLMSAYSRGSVPVERQLAQMLFEVPHHMKVIPTDGENTQDVEFTLTELSMQQAEDLASSIKALDDGEIDV